MMNNSTNYKKKQVGNLQQTSGFRVQTEQQTGLEIQWVIYFVGIIL